MRPRSRPIIAQLAAVASAGCALALPSALLAEDNSPPVILQYFESRYLTIESRMPDIFKAGYGIIYTPPPGRAEQGSFSVGYDQFDRFDLGKPNDPTLYGTELGLKTTINQSHRAGLDHYIDLVWNHDGFADQGSVDGQGHRFGPDAAHANGPDAGGYPGFNIYLPSAVDGDFHGKFAGGDLDGRLAGLIDINHSTNFQMIRNPVPGFANNIRPGNQSAFGRLANVPDDNNRRFYPDQSLQPIMVFDPNTGQGDIPIYPFNNANPLAGDPIPENGLGYLMRNAQWLVQSIGVDGFRIDAEKHMEGFVLNYFDRAVYRSSKRNLLDGSTRHIFSFGEVFDGSFTKLDDYVLKNIDPSQPGVIGGNRDVLDFPLFFALKANLSDNGLNNDWRNIVDASFDLQLDGLHNGSQGVTFVSSHDSDGPDLSNVAYAYTLSMPGNTIVYFNAREFGNGRDFPKNGRGDALGGFYGDAIKTLIDIRNTHGRGNYIERWREKELFAFERRKSMIVMLSNRTDGGIDNRTLLTTFDKDTPLIELTGNAANPAIDPFDDFPELIVVHEDHTINVTFPRNKAPGANGAFHRSAYLIYGVSGPQGTLNLTNISQTLTGQTPTADTNDTARLSNVYVIAANSFDVSLQTDIVNLLGFYRDPDADGDNAILRIDDGVDINANGQVDFRSPGSVSYGFENFLTKKSPRFGGGDGEYRQTIDSTLLAEGMHYITARAFRHRAAGDPAVFTDFKKVIYIDRFKPLSNAESFDPIAAGVNENRRVLARSLDLTADNIHIFLDLAAGLTDAQVLALASANSQANRLDRDLWSKDFAGITNGNHVLTLLSFELDGNSNVQRFPGYNISTILGAGFGDLNFNGGYSPADVSLFTTIYNSNNSQFNPAGDGNGDGLVDETDLLLLGPRLTTVLADTATLQAYNNLLISPAGTRTVTFTLNNSTGSTLTKTGNGTININGPQSHGAFAQLFINGGTANLNTDAGSAASANLAVSVNNGSSLNFGSTQHLAYLTIDDGTATLPPGGDKVLVTGGLTINADGKLDLADNDAVIHSSADQRIDTLNGMTSLIAVGRHAGDWLGDGITSSAAAADSAHLTGLAIALNDNGQNQPLYTTFAGQSVTLNDILIKYTWNGDTDLNGLVDADDYFNIDSGFSAGSSGYSHGDFDYSGGPPDADDYFLIDSSFAGQTGPLGAGIAAVPEPASLILLCAVTTFSLRKRRR